MPTKQQITIAQILEMTPGDRQNPTWINGEFVASISQVEIKYTKTGTPYATCQFFDPDTSAEIGATFFGRKFLPPSGMVSVGGAGLQLTEYNGTPQLTGSAKTTVQAVGGCTQRAVPPPAAQNRTQTRSAAPGHAQPSPGRQNGAAAPAGHILGVTVGMALNNACAIQLEALKQGTCEVGPDYWRAVWDHASQILRIAAVLEKGKLAPKPEIEPRTEDEPQTGPQDDPEADLVDQQAVLAAEGAIDDGDVPF